MSTTSEAPRWNDLHSTELPGIRSLMAFDDKILAVTLACEVRLIQGGQLMGEWKLISDQEKASALERVRSVSLFPDRSGFFAAAGTSLWKVSFDMEDPVWVRRMKESFGFLHNSPYAVVALPNGRLWASTDNGDLGLLEGNGGFLKRRSDNHSPHHAFLVPGGIAGADGNSICVWDIESLKRTKTLPQDGHVFNLIAHPRLPLVAVKVDASVMTWDVEKGECLNSFPVAPGLGVFAWHPLADCIAVGVDQGVEVVSCEGRVLSKHHDEGMRYLSAAFEPGGEAMYIGCDDGSIRMVRM